MNKNIDQLPLKQSTKTIQRFKTLPIQQRVHMVSNELLGNVRRLSKSKVSRPTNAKPIKKTEEQLTNRIKLLQAELQKKLSHDGILRNFFKTLNSSELSRIDIYLQLKKCEEIIEPLQIRLSQESEKSQRFFSKIEKLQDQLEEKQKKYIQNMVILESQFDENYKNKENELNNLREIISALKNELQTNKLLLSEIKKKNQSLVQQNKSLVQESKSNDKKYQKGVKEFETVKRQMEQKIDQLQLKRQHITNQFEQLKNKHAGLILKIEKYEKIKAQLSENISVLHEQYQLKNRQITKYKQVVCLQESQMSELQNTMIKKDQTIANLNKRIQQQTQKYFQNVQLLETENNHLKAGIQQSRELIKQLEMVRNKNEQSSKSDRTMIKELKERQQTLIKYYENERAEMMIELKKEKYHDIQNESLRKRYQLDQAEKETTILKLQDKISNLIVENNSMSKKLEESQKDLEKYKGNEKINQRIYGENYKTAGRLGQIKKQINLVLNAQVAHEQDQNAEQSLEKVTSTFAKAVYSLILQCKSSTQRMQTMRKYLNQRVKQFCNLLHHFKNAVQIDNIDSLIQKYIGHFESLSQIDIKNHESLNQTYHLILQKLINGQKSKKCITEASINIVNDSLDNVIFKQNQRESIEKVIFDKKYEQSIRSTNNLYTYSRSKQPESNKQNVNNANEPQRFSKQKNIGSYNSIEKQADHSNGIRKSSGRIRSEIQRKYFRS